MKITAIDLIDLRNAMGYTQNTDIQIQERELNLVTLLNNYNVDHIYAFYNRTGLFGQIEIHAVYQMPDDSEMEWSVSRFRFTQYGIVEEYHPYFGYSGKSFVYLYTGEYKLGQLLSQIRTLTNTEIKQEE